MQQYIDRQSEIGEKTINIKSQLIEVKLYSVKSFLKKSASAGRTATMILTPHDTGERLLIAC